GPPRGDPQRDRALESGHRRRDRRQGARDDAGDRKRGDAVRRPQGRRRARGARVRFTLASLAAASGARLEGDAELTGVAVDSRSVREGDLFVAIRGARVDGHDFAVQAAGRGARALLAERLPDGLPSGFPAALSPKPIDALQRFASAERKRIGFRLAAITGSVGKTTTKDF